MVKSFLYLSFVLLFAFNDFNNHLWVYEAITPFSTNKYKINKTSIQFETSCAEENTVLDADD